MEARKIDSNISIKCARCMVKEKESDAEHKHNCDRCGKNKHISEYGPLIAKEWLGAKRSNMLRWKCYECQYPPCATCNARPLYAVPHNTLVEGKYYCRPCRYPPCKKCGASRRDPGSRQRFKEYACDAFAIKEESAGVKECSECRKKKNVSNFLSYGGHKRHDVCKDCMKPRECKRCSETKPSFEFDQRASSNDCATTRWCKECKKHLDLETESWR